jgi:hypothetical protein
VIWFILKFDKIEAKQTGSILILYFKEQKNEPSLFLKMKAKKRKGVIVTYRIFAIPNPHFSSTSDGCLADRHIGCRWCWEAPPVL